MSHQTITSESFYQTIMQQGNLRTPKHAARLTFAVLRTLGFNLGSRVKRDLADALPEEMAKDLTRGWRLINIRHSNLSVHDFAKQVARNSGNTDPKYAQLAIKVVFKQIKEIIDDRLVRAVARDLSPDMRDFWNAA